MNRLLIIVALVACAGGETCTSPQRARATLQQMGLRDIQLTGYVRACTRDDSTCTGFTAVNARGAVIEGAVGCNAGCIANSSCSVRITP